MGKKKGTKFHVPEVWNENQILNQAEKNLANEKYPESVKGFEQIPESSPNFARASKGRGAALLRLNRLSEALPFLQTAHQAFPNDPNPLLDGADVVRLMGNLEVAEDTYAEARKLGADSFQFHFGVTAILETRKLWLRAMEGWKKLSAEFPENATVLHNLGKVWHELGETDKAVSCFREALTLDDRLQTRISLATIAPHAAVCDHVEVKKIRTELGEHLVDLEGISRLSPPERYGNEKIKIGYVSAFFHRSNWMKPVWALLNHQDRERFEVHLFADGPIDEIVGQGGYHFDKRDKLHDSRELDNRRLADRIHDHKIDVLVDLNSYSAVGRLGLWVTKPAPISIGWFNLYATSGMPGIDWLIGDHVVIRDSEAKFYTEKILRLNQSYLTFQVRYNTPDIKLPTKSNVFTIGCLGSGYKITPDVRAAWIKLLKTTRNTRMILRNRLFAEADHRNWFSDFFAEQGVDTTRLILLGPADHQEFLATYGEIDLALDTFPYNGGTTTMESLWQGVPVVCFNGDRWISRTSATLMHAAGLESFVGSDVDEYISIAADWSSDKRRAQLRKIRVEMRSLLKSSPVCDGEGLARDFERTLDEIRQK